MRQKLFKIIAKFPEYQSVPELSLTFVLKQRIRLFLLYFGTLILTTKRQKEKLQKTKTLKNSKIGKSVILCASGPGGDKFLNDLIVKPKKLNNIDIAVVNSFYKNKFSDSVVPNYYFLSDPYFWENTPSANKSRKDIIKCLAKNMNCYLVIPFLNEPFIELSRTLFINNLVYFKKNKDLSPIKGNLTPSSVVFHAISFLSFLGYKPIYVNGLDASFHTTISVNKANEMFMHIDKLYGDQKDEYIFDRSPQINTSNRDVPPRSVSELLAAESVMLRDLNFYSHHGLVNIGDDTTNDALPRASLWQHPSIQDD